MVDIQITRYYLKVFLSFNIQGLEHHMFEELLNDPKALAPAALNMNW